MKAFEYFSTWLTITKEDDRFETNDIELGGTFVI